MEDAKPFDKRIDRMLNSNEPIERAAAIIAWGLDRVAKQLETSPSADGTVTSARPLAQSTQPPAEDGWQGPPPTWAREFLESKVPLVKTKMLRWLAENPQGWKKLQGQCVAFSEDKGLIGFGIALEHLIDSVKWNKGDVTGYYRVPPFSEKKDGE